MKYEAGELSHLCQRVMFTHVDRWPESYYEALKIQLPEGAVFVDAGSEIVITDYESFVLNQPAVESIKRVTYQN